MRVVNSHLDSLDPLVEMQGECLRQQNKYCLQVREVYVPAVPDVLLVLGSSLASSNSGSCLSLIFELDLLLRPNRSLEHRLGAI
jgi:hypothetical protein